MLRNIGKQSGNPWSQCRRRKKLPWPTRLFPSAGREMSLLSCRVLCPCSHSLQLYSSANSRKRRLGGVMVKTCDSECRGSPSLVWSFYATTLGKLLTLQGWVDAISFHIYASCLSSSSTIWYRSRASIVCGWECNRRSGVALVMRQGLQWFIHLRLRAHGLRTLCSFTSRILVLSVITTLQTFGDVEAMRCRRFPLSTLLR